MCVWFSSSVHHIPPSSVEGYIFAAVFCKDPDGNLYLSVMSDHPIKRKVAPLTYVIFKLCSRALNYEQGQ